MVHTDQNCILYVTRYMYNSVLIYLLGLLQGLVGALRSIHIVLSMHGASNVDFLECLGIK